MTKSDSTPERFEKIVYRVRDKLGTWHGAYPTSTLETGREYLDHVRRRFSSNAKLYKVTEIWEEVK